MSYPRRFSEIDVWASTNQATIPDARRRFAQFAVLSSIAGNPDLARSLIFKDGNALDFVWQSNRSTIDLDFTADPNIPVENIEPTMLQVRLIHALAPVSARHGMLLVVNKIVQNPPGTGRTFVTYRTTIGYALPDQGSLRNRMERGIPSSQVIPLDISINEIVCASKTIAFVGNASLRVCTIEDIVAEKLRALLQQAPRKRNRPQDLLDIAVAVQRDSELDRTQIGQFVLDKSASRASAVHKSAFHTPEFAELTRAGYQELSLTARHTFIPFNEALAILLAFIGQLPIPD